VSKPTRTAKATPPEIEPQWPGLMAVLAAAVLSWMMPLSLSPGPGWVPVVAVGILALVSLLLPRWHDELGYAKAAIATFSLTYALVALVRDLVNHHGDPKDLLSGALLIWSMNVLVFASWYWRLDEGGPQGRSKREVYCGGAFLFPQVSLPGETRESIGATDWRPRFVDYLFIAFNSSTAFSPTDVPVLSRWAKVLMMIQSSISLTTLAIVAARAVNIL
jgi:hypothetical protein